MESLDQFRRLEVMSLRLSDHKVLHNIASVLIKFFRFRSDLLAFFARISYFQILEFKEFNKTIIQFALVGYETGIANSALRASLAIYHLIPNARSWTNCYFLKSQMEKFRNTF